MAQQLLARPQSLRSSNDHQSTSSLQSRVELVEFHCDATICNRVRQRLSSSGYRPLSEIIVVVHNGVVCLRGRVRSWYLKQMAQEVTMLDAEMDNLRNEIEVVREE